MLMEPIAYLCATKSAQHAKRYESKELAEQASDALSVVHGLDLMAMPLDIVEHTNKQPGEKGLWWGIQFPWGSYTNRWIAIRDPEEDI